MCLCTSKVVPSFQDFNSSYLFEVFVRYDPVLQAVVTVTEELAYEQAKEADQLLSQGVYLGMQSIFWLYARVFSLNTWQVKYLDFYAREIW